MGIYFIAVLSLWWKSPYMEKVRLYIKVVPCILYEGFMVWYSPGQAKFLGDSSCVLLLPRYSGAQNFCISIDKNMIHIYHMANILSDNFWRTYDPSYDTKFITFVGLRKSGSLMRRLTWNSAYGSVSALQWRHNGRVSVSNHSLTIAYSIVY